LNDSEINKLDRPFQSVLYPKKRGHKPLKNPIVLTFDIEDEPAEEIVRPDSKGQPVYYHDRRPVAITFAYQLPDGKVESIGIPLKENFSMNQLLQWTLDFLKNLNVQVEGEKVKIHLISHFAISEIRHLKDWQKAGIPRTYMNGQAMYLEHKIEHEGRTYILMIIDTFAHWLSGLGAIAEWVGKKKISLDGVGGKSDYDWKHNMKELFEKYPDVAWQYAKNDSEILIEAFNKWRNFFLEEFDYDVLNASFWYKPAPSSAYISGDLFRLHFLQEPVELIEVVKIKTTRKTKDIYRSQLNKEIQYAGSWDRRRLVLKGYWGGRREAFIHGLYRQPVDLLDFSEFYLTCAYNQPLPCKDTEWLHLKGLDQLDSILKMEGVAKITFEFPENTAYPSLPVKDEAFGKLVFPLTGETICTIFELRKALEQRVKIHSIEAWGFVPTEKEINHPLRRFLDYWRKRKHDVEDRLGKEQAEKTLEYRVSKLMSNALIGKFVQRVDSWSFEDSVLLLQAVDFNELRYQELMKRKESKTQKVGTLWSPEWSSLILGRARAMLGLGFRLVNAITGHTDSIVCPALIPEQREQLITIMEEENTPINHVGTFDSMWILRSACYVYFEDGRPKKLAHHGYSTSCPQCFGCVIHVNLQAGKPIANYTFKDTMVKPFASLKRNLPLGATYIKKTEIQWLYDSKRELIDPNINVFTEHSQTRPWKASEQGFQEEIKLKEPPKKERMVLTQEQVQQIFQLCNQGLSIRQIAEQLNLSKSRIGRVLKPAFRPELEFLPA
jgi:hypothetical protein